MSYLTYNPTTNRYPIRGFSNPNTVRSPDAIVNDPYFDNVALLLTDSLIDIKQGLSPVESNGVTLNPTTKKYGVNGIQFSGINSRATYNSSDFAFGNDPYTVEFWVNVTGSTSNKGFWALGNSLTSFTNRIDLNVYQNNLRCFGTQYNYAFLSRLNLWTHVATVRAQGRNKLYINGVLSGDISDALNVTEVFLHIGSYVDFTGYNIEAVFDSFRVTKGVARYTANFDPETDTFLDL